MNTYQIKETDTNETVIVKNNQQFIPIDPLNPDYLEYVAWLFDGNTAEEWQSETTTESVEP